MLPTCLAPLLLAPNLNVCPCTRARPTYGRENNADSVIEASVLRLLLRLAIVNTSGHQGSDLEGKCVNEKFDGQEASGHALVPRYQ